MNVLRLGAAPARYQATGGRALSREAIARSADLQRCYAAEYASMLRVVSDGEVAKEAARMNLSALLIGQPRIVPAEGRFSVERLRDAMTRAGEDLAAIRSAVSCLVAPDISRLGPRRTREWGPER
jgi:hypothetical protein